MNMRDIYRQRKVYPRIQVTPDDIRRYYDRNLDKEFTERSKIQFRLIKIEQKKIGSRDETITRITEIREKAMTADFAELASTVNHDEKLKKDGGNVGFIERGSFRIEEVEKEVWDTPQGEVTDIIETDEAFYIAKVEQKENGRVRAFEEPVVQAAIANKLRSEQFEVLLAVERAALRDQAVVNYDRDTMLEPAIEMAMQNYPRWATAQ
jgi:parvulin-like peptidyl-prolyl isomerase